VRELGEEIVGAPAALRRAGDALAEDVLLGEEQRAVVAKALLDAERSETDLVTRQRLQRGPALKPFAFDTGVLLQQVGEAVERAGAEGAQDYLAARLHFPLDISTHSVVDLPLAGAAVRCRA